MNLTTIASTAHPLQADKQLGNSEITGVRPERDDRFALERYVIPNLRNSSRVLKLLAQRSRGCRHSEISRAQDIPATTALRILATLQLEVWVSRKGNRFELATTVGGRALVSNDAGDRAWKLAQGGVS